MVCEASRLCWRLFVRGMNATEVEMRHEQGNRVTQVFKNLAVSHRQAREPAIKQAAGKIQSLNMTGADSGGVWIANANPSFDLHTAFGWSKCPHSFGHGEFVHVNFSLLCEMHVLAKGKPDRLRIGRKGISG
jgi:hypothetical protein